ncbi:MAG: ExeM/NucH family extracellular endonuclease [Paracoccaceae bacterium]
MATLFSETFETATPGSNQDALGAFTFLSGATQTFTDGFGDFFGVSDNADAAGLFGSFIVYNGNTTQYLAGNDLDGEGAALPIVIQTTGIDISGATNLMLSLDAAEDDDGSNQDWDIVDFVHVSVQIDNGGFVDVLNFESIPDGDAFNAVPAVDTDFDGDGDGTQITDTFATFMAGIAGTGSLLDIQIEFQLNAGDEDIALDNITITGDVAPPPVTPLINEFQPNPDGNDPANQTVELKGAPNTAFDLWLISIEDDGSDGLVDRAANVTGTFDANGIATVSVPDLENPSFTYILTDGFTGGGETDFDSDGNGTIDLDLASVGITQVFDAIGIVDDGSELTYAEQLGGTTIPFTGTEPELVFRDGVTDALFAVNAIAPSTPSATVFDADGAELFPTAFDIDPTAGTTFGAVNPSLSAPTETTLSISDVSQTEGDTGTTNFEFTVTRSGDTSGVTTVNFATADGTATAGSDYTATSGTLTFAADGPNTQTVTVAVTGDTDPEDDEAFVVELTNASGSTIVSDATGQGTILNDDAAPLPSVIINEVHFDPASDLSGDANGDGTRGASEDEFVEIVNTGGTAVDISGWTLSDDDGDDFAFPGGTILSAGQAAVLFGGGTPTGSFGGALVFADDGSIGNGLANGGDAVELRDAVGSLVDSVAYGSAGAVSGGNDQSVTRDPDLTGGFVDHSGATGANGALFSPGTRIDGTPFDPNATLLSINDVTMMEGDSGTTDFVFTVTRSGDTSGVTMVDFATADGTATAGSDYTSNSGTLTFMAGGPNTQTVTVSVTGDMDAEQNETFNVALSNATNGAFISDATGLGTIQNDDGVVISQINQVQGDGAVSPIVGDMVTIEAIVTGDFQDGDADTQRDLRGFFVQEEDTDTDANPLTSEGIFVFDGSSPATDVNIGDLVQITATVAEFFGETQLTNPTITIVSSENTLPTATQIDTTTLSTRTNSDGDIIADYEQFEGMLVTYPETFTVSDLFTLGRFGDFGLYRGDSVLETYTQANLPSVPGFQQFKTLAARDTVIVDDGKSIQNPAVIPFEVEGVTGDVAGQLDANDELSAGDTVDDLTGVVRFSRGSGGFGDEIYRVLPTDADDLVIQNTDPREATAPDVGGDITVSSFNLLNFFTSIDDERGRNNNPLNAGPTPLEPRGANDLTNADPGDAPSTQAQNDALAEFNRQLDKLIAAFTGVQATIFGLIELENEFPGFVDPSNTGGLTAVETLLSELNTAIPTANYQFASPAGDPTFGDQSDAITVALLYDANLVEIASGTTVEILKDADLAGLGVDPGVPVFDGASTNRAPIAATFEELATGETFTVAVNHFKSKGSPGTALSGDDDIGDGVGNANQTRENAAIALDAWLDTDPTGSGDPDVLIIGDLNAYAMETPIRTLVDEGYADQVSRFLDPGEFPFSFGFPVDLGTVPQAQSFGALDYALANPSLASQVTGAAEWQINSNESTAFDYNLEFRPQAQADGLFAATPFRASDHDPVIIGLDLGGEDPQTPVVEGTAQGEVVRGTDAAEDIIPGAGSDRIFGGDGGDNFIFGLTDNPGDRNTIYDFEGGVDSISFPSLSESQVNVRVLNSSLAYITFEGTVLFVRGSGIDEDGLNLEFQDLMIS